jgi:hypothetical protein
MKPCSIATCFAPEATCALGHLNTSACSSWKSSGQQSNAAIQNGDEIVLPWSGRALGLTDIGFVAGRARPTLVGIVGPENAGKTTLLAAWYLLLSRGMASSHRYRFAGSFTLLGWEAVARSMQWNPGSTPQFPAHTASRGGRGQGLLHLGFREDTGLVRDYLFTDAPGMWFQRWAVNENAADAAGARWIFEHADAFILVADREALSGKDRGSARAALQLLGRRIAATRQGRPVILVWTKSDIQITLEIERAVRESVQSQIPDAAEFHISVSAQGEQQDGRGVGLADVLDGILQLKRLKQSLPPLRADSNDPLFLFGAR